MDGGPDCSFLGPRRNGERSGSRRRRVPRRRTPETPVEPPLAHGDHRRLEEPRGPPSPGAPSEPRRIHRPHALGGRVRARRRRCLPRPARRRGDALGPRAPRAGDPGGRPRTRLPAAGSRRVRPGVRPSPRGSGAPRPGGLWAARGLRRGRARRAPGGEPGMLPDRGAPRDRPARRARARRGPGRRRRQERKLGGRPRPDAGDPPPGGRPHGVAVRGAGAPPPPRDASRARAHRHRGPQDHVRAAPRTAGARHPLLGLPDLRHRRPRRVAPALRGSLSRFTVRAGRRRPAASLGPGDEPLLPLRRARRRRSGDLQRHRQLGEGRRGAGDPEREPPDGLARDRRARPAGYAV